MASLSSMVCRINTSRSFVMMFVGAVRCATTFSQEGTPLVNFETS